MAACVPFCGFAVIHLTNPHLKEKKIQFLHCLQSWVIFIISWGREERKSRSSYTLPLFSCNQSYLIPFHDFEVDIIYLYLYFTEKERGRLGLSHAGSHSSFSGRIGVWTKLPDWSLVYISLSPERFLHVGLLSSLSSFQHRHFIVDHVPSGTKWPFPTYISSYIPVS